MSNVNISGYGDDLTINGVRIGDLSPKGHEDIEKKMGGRNYKPLENVVVSHVQDSSTLICRKPSTDNINAYIEEELMDGLCCYSAVNQGSAQPNDCRCSCKTSNRRKTSNCTKIY